MVKRLHTTSLALQNCTSRFLIFNSAWRHHCRRRVKTIGCKYPPSSPMIILMFLFFFLAVVKVNISKNEVLLQKYLKSMISAFIAAVDPSLCFGSCGPQYWNVPLLFVPPPCAFPPQFGWCPPGFEKSLRFTVYLGV